jgi:Dolichyl-phosphate-mannose-protein mannosyltransferase
MNSSELVVSPQTASLGVLQAGEPARSTALAPVLTVCALTMVGAAIRIVVAHQSVFADELSTYWISVDHGLGGVLSLLYGTGRIAHAEITPPLSFLLSWLSTRFGDTPELLRAPALLAGTATIPLVYVLGLRTVVPRAALAAAALTAFSPFMIYYSAEARAYGIMMFFVVCSTIAMLSAIDTGRTRWWVVYGFCSAAAFYTHYTSSFVVAAALLWTLWAHPEARRPALAANCGAALLVVPWIPGLINDLTSPTLKILSALSPFTAHAIRIDIQHWAIGYPYSSAGGLTDLPGVPALLLLGGAALLTAGGLRARGRVVDGTLRQRSPGALLERVDKRVLLVVVLAAVTPVGETVASAFGNHIIGVRDLAASWPFLAIAAAAAMAAAGPRLGIAAAALAVLALVLGALRLFETRFERPNYQAAADYVAAHAGDRDVVIDFTLSPGPLTPLDVTLHRRLRVIRALQPAERDHPFGFTDPVVPLRTAVAQAAAAANGARVFVVRPVSPGTTRFLPVLSPVKSALGARYRLATLHAYGGIEATLVAVYTDGRANPK